MGQIVVVCSEFNKHLVDKLYQTAKEEFKEHLQFFADHYPQSKIKPLWVPGAGEIPLAVKWVIEQTRSKYYLKKWNPLNAWKQLQGQEVENPELIAVLALGVIIKGQTGHYDFLNGFLQKSLWDLQKTYSIPILFSILMLGNREQAKNRIVRTKEAVNALIQMIKLKRGLTR